MLRRPALVALALCGAACASSPPPPGALDPGVLHGVLANGLVQNGLLQDLASVSLTDASLSSLDGLAPLVEDDPGVATFLRYLVSCALPAGARVSVGGHTFEGDAGLGAAWATGPCDVECQEWVSACLLARTNAYGIPVVIHTRGPHPALGDVTPEMEAAFPVEEGAFWGNFFLDPPREHACRGRGRDPLMSTFRVCAQRGSRCGIQYVGPCGSIDGATGEASERHACERFDEASGGYVGCHERASLPGSDAFPEGTTGSPRVVTVYLRATDFVAGGERACAAEPWPAPVPASPPRGAGASCANDDDCDGARGLFCDARQPQGMCTAACAPSSDAGAEEAACGGAGSTCLALGEGGICTASCAPGVAGGDCDPGKVCTGLSLLAASPDRPGCYPFCSHDEECGPGQSCNRFGGCQPTLLDETLALADGEPCTLREVGGAAPDPPCRGGCIRVVAGDPTRGICATLIDLTETPSCPDDPDRVLPIRRGGDDLAVCLYRTCASDAECTPPLRCRIQVGAPSICTY